MPLVLSGTNGISADGTYWGVSPKTGGYVKHPNIAACAVAVASNTSSVAGSTITALFAGNSNVIFDNKNNYNSATGRFTCPVDGVYLISFNLLVNATSGWARAWVYKNGSSVWDGLGTNYSSMTYAKASGTWTFTANANDYIEIRYDAFNASYVYGGGSPYYSNFSITHLA